MEEIIEKLKKEARNSWSGQEGEERATRLETYLRNKLAEYSEVTGLAQEDILAKWEESRDYSAINYYQEANQPSLARNDVRVFDTVDEAQKAMKRKGFRCPSCEGVSKNPYECTSGEKMKSGKTCDWKVYGLFGHMGKGVHIFIKEAMRGDDIFMPLAWEEVKQ